MRFREFKNRLVEAFTVPLPQGRIGPEVADVQKALIALGYQLPKYGVDGIRGSETSSAVSQFQKDNQLKVDGDPGPETVAKLNELLKEVPDAAVKITQSTQADVKRASPQIQAVSAQAKVANAVSPNEISSYLTSKGLDKNQVLGILANIKSESNFDAGAIGDNGTSGGLFQHHADRFAGMIAAAGGDNQWQQNWKAQIDYALSEPAGRQYIALRFTSPEQATEWWTRKFEIPANVDQQVALRQRNLTAFV